MQSVNNSADPIPPLARDVAIPSANYQWILSPQIDILFACGGMTWIFWFIIEKLGVVRSLDNVPGACIWVSWLVAVHLFANDHAFLGWHRVATSAYVKPEVRKRLGYLAGFFCIVLIPVILNPIWATALAKIYVILLVQHFAAQAYGVSMLYCIKRRYTMNKVEKEILHWVFNCLTIMVTARALTYREFSGCEFFEGLVLPFWGPLPPLIYQVSLGAFIVSVLLFAGMVVYKFVHQKLLFPLPALMATMTIIGLYFVTLSNHEPMVGIIMSGFYHGSQNFVVALACHLKERGLPDNVPPSKISSMLLTPYTIRYCFFIATAGVLLFVVLPRLLTLLSVPLQITIAGVFALQGFHHFITEGVVWRLRNPEVRNILVA